MATVYCGVDFHARQQTICYLTTESSAGQVAGEIHHQELAHDLEQVRKFYAGLRPLGQVIVGFESSGYAAWFEELLEELSCDIWVGQASEIRKRAHRRQKNDRRDAELILELMLRGDFPRLHRYSPGSREVLQQLRHRQRLVKMRTMVINSLRFITVSRGVTIRGKLLHRRTQQRLLELSLPSPLDQQRQELCALLVELQAKIAVVEGWLSTAAESHPQVRRLRTHPGIGPLTGLCLAATLERIERFANGRKVTAYVGFDPVEESSGQRRRIGSISKEGPRLLRLFLNEAGLVAVRHDQELGRVYQRLLRRRGHAIAKVAVARRLLVRAFIMLRDEIDYHEFVSRGVAARSSRRSG
jgi:transposase